MTKETFVVRLPLTKDQVDLSRLPRKYVEDAVRAVGEKVNLKEGNSNGGN